jgi:hypothetical protein
MFFVLIDGLLKGLELGPQLSSLSNESTGTLRIFGFNGRTYSLRPLLRRISQNFLCEVVLHQVHQHQNQQLMQVISVEI